ncbi:MULTISPECIES: hypothetical protein [Flavobacterium]|uniref:hypothetical protein n=1 Tax=Flavobacterium TaxID=237 RepID=UPI001FCC4F2F|nr:MULTISPECIES: hypothetical protein [Flavobacterium]UOK41487.1 hypothetical protein LZF87_09170 [Flavobacterium enshiense]
MRIQLLALCFILSCLSCKNSDDGNLQEENQSSEKTITFDKTKWNTKDGQDYPYRDKMLTDLRANDKLKKLNKSQVLALLGQPNREDKNYLFYTIAQERLGFFPLHTKTLVLRLSDKSMVEAVLIHE